MNRIILAALVLLVSLGGRADQTHTFESPDHLAVYGVLGVDVPVAVGVPQAVNIVVEYRNQERFGGENHNTSVGGEQNFTVASWCALVSGGSSVSTQLADRSYTMSHDPYDGVTDYAGPSGEHVVTTTGTRLVKLTITDPAEVARFAKSSQQLLFFFDYQASLGGNTGAGQTYFEMRSGFSGSITYSY